jgi:hypothetical protein
MPAGTQHREQSRDHHSDASRFRMILKSLIPEATGVLMTHRRPLMILQPKAERLNRNRQSLLNRPPSWATLLNMSILL